MATSSIQRTAASGSTAVFSVPFPYLDKSHVQVRVADALLVAGTDYSWPTSSTIQLTAGNPTAGTVVERKRVTPVSPLTNFQPGNLDSGDLNVGILQPLYVAQEGVDSAGDALLRAWFTANYGDGGTITVGADGTVLMWDAAGNIVEGPSADDIASAQAAATAALASQAAAAASALDAATSAATVQPIATQIHAATAKTTPVDADEDALADSAASWAIKKVTWANRKATLKAYFDALYAPISVAFSNLAAGAIATNSEFQLGTASKLLTAAILKSTVAYQTLTDAATIAWDMSLGNNALVVLGGNRTLGNPTNANPLFGFVLKVTASVSTRTLDKGANWVAATGVESFPISVATTETVFLVGFVDTTNRIVITGVVRT